MGNFGRIGYCQMFLIHEYLVNNQFFCLSSVTIPHFICKMDDYHLFCTKTGVSHASMPAHWCQYCGKRTKQVKEDVQEDTIFLAVSSSIRPGPDSTPRTPNSKPSLREGTADAPISLDDTPNTPRTAGVSVPLSQTQALSKVYLAPGLREVEHAHARNETTKARIQSVSGRSGYTINPEDKGPKAVPQYLTSHQAHTPKFSRKGLSFSAPKIKENQFLIDLDIVIVYYCRYLGTDTAVFQSFKTHRTCYTGNKSLYSHITRQRFLPRTRSAIRKHGGSYKCSTVRNPSLSSTSVCFDPSEISCCCNS